ncbi:MAG: Type 1 glutamine amidotransferase-like domain-containing protein [Candidatus Levyibacteriota bacterium]|jgi:dipeptidase E
MKRLFLTSSISFVAQDIAKRINQRNLKLAFITTPAEVEEGNLQWLKDDRQSLVNAGFLVTDYTITGKAREEIKTELSKYDVLYMSGGNTFYLLEKIQTSNSTDVFKDLVNNGTIYIGTSAGSIITGPDIYPLKDMDNIKKAPNIKGYEGLGLVNFVIFPHWGNEHFKDRYLNQRLKDAYNTNNEIILLPDGTYILVENDFYKIIKVKQK